MQTVRLVGCALLSLFVAATCKAACSDNAPNVDDASATVTEAAPSPAPAPKPSSEGRFAIGVGVKVSTLGIGGEVAIPVVHRLNARVGFNAFNYNHTFDKDGVTYKGALDLRSAEALLDFFPLGSFHLSPGVMLYNGNKISANASVPGGDTFTLNSVTYTSDPANPIAGTGKMKFYKVAPMFLFGFGNLVPRNHRFSVSFELGAVYQGPPRTTLALTGNACDASGLNCVDAATDPSVQSNILAEQAKINKNASPFRFYPVVSFGVGYRF